MKTIELFAGAGGLGLGVAQAGFHPVQIVEWDRWCCDTIRENRAKASGRLAGWPTPDEADIRGLDFSHQEGRVDLVTGGPPCQPFSLGGKHRAHADERDLWTETVRVVRQTKPKAFLFENVKGLTRSSFTEYFSYVLRQLTHPEIAPRAGESWTAHLSRLERHHSAKGAAGRGLSYNVLARVLNAADYGVPQRRERVVFVGFRSDLGIEWSFPQATHALDALLWDQVRSVAYWERNRVAKKDRSVAPRLAQRAEKLLERPEGKAWITVREALKGLPDPERSPKAASRIQSHRFQAGARSYPGHTGSPLDEAAKTLKAGVHGVPGGENMLCRKDGSIRYFSVRESARLQTFPDDYRFHGSWSETMRQLGNAVPVQLAQILAKDVLAHLHAASPDSLPK
ncbi:MAG: DNA cytosine methyltransferase [Rhodospirillaceae bacterium]